MAGIFRITFADVICGAGKVMLVFERACTPDELLRNPGAATADLDIDGDPDLILSTPSQEGILEAKNGNSLCSELSLKFLDTFQTALFNFKGANVGIGKGIFDKTADFGLLALLTEWDIARRQTTGMRTYPPGGVVISYYLNDYTNPKMKAVLEPESVTFDVDFLIGETVRGTLLKNNEYFRYDAAEKTLQISAIDYIRWLLLQTGVKEGFMHDGIFGHRAERREPPVNIVGATDGIYILRSVDLRTSPSPAFSHEDTTALIRDSWAVGTFNGRPTPYRYLTIFNVGNGEPDPANKRRAMSWLGFPIAAMMKALYDRALIKWSGDADRCNWKFYCAGIDESAFKKIQPSNYGEDTNGYNPYLGTRLQVHEPANHNVVTKFRILKSENDDEDIFLDNSFSADYLSDAVIGHDSFEYSFGNYPSAWEVVTKVPGSLGYRSRYSWRKGIPHVQHIQKSRKPPLVSIPAAMSLKGTPFGKAVDGIMCKPVSKFGRFHAFRRTVTQPYYTTVQFTTSRAHTAEMKEPYYDDTIITLVWDSKIDYFEVYPSKVENRQSSFREQVTNINNDQVSIPATSNVSNPFECETCFALMGNYPVVVFGGQGTSGDYADETDGNAYPMQPEVVFVPAGSIAEKALGDRIEVTSYSSAYPGLILYAGRDTVHHGRVISPSAAIAGDDFDFFRGCGSIDVPYGDDGTFRRAYSARSALGMFNAQHHIGRGETQTIIVPGVDNFENEKGETGYDAIYEGLAILLFGTLYLITRVKQLSEEDQTEIDIQPIPPEIPIIADETPRFVLDSNFNVTTTWDEIYELSFILSDGKTQIPNAIDSIFWY